ncbi:MAG: DUF2384 domain-containing protein [Azospirillaceae bacterium]
MLDMRSPGGAPDGIPDLTDARERDALAPAALEAYRRIVELWGLGNDDAAALLDVSPATWGRVKAGGGTRLGQDQMLRLSCLLGIFKALELLFDGPLRRGWPMRPNADPAFGGSSPVAFMRREGLPGFGIVRGYLDALRGGA